MPLDPRKDAESFIDSLDDEPDLQMAVLEACSKLGAGCSVRQTREKKVRLLLSPDDAEFLAGLIGDSILRKDQRKQARKIYRQLLKSGINDSL